MPPLTAMLHTNNSAVSLGRTLETLLPFAEILVVDHYSADGTLRIARAYGARIVLAENKSAKRHLDLARHNWIFCIAPGESITESLQASLYEWSILSEAETMRDTVHIPGYSVRVRELRGESWQENLAPETRLIPRSFEWNGGLQTYDPATTLLEGELLRFL
jgi:glycosyltransferase involved in cell wall biosynthesis